MKTDSKTPGIADASQFQKTARMAGFLYLIFIVTLIYADLSVQKLIVQGDAAATANKIAAQEWVFRLGFISELVSTVFFLLTAWALYVLLRPVNKNLAFLFVLLNLGGVAIQCLNVINLIATLLLSSGADYLTVFRADQQKAMAMLFLNLHKNGFIVAQIFYGAWLFPLGYLVFRSGFLPRILGVLLIMDGFGVLIWFSSSSFSRAMK